MKTLQTERPELSEIALGPAHSQRVVRRRHAERAATFADRKIDRLRRSPSGSTGTAPLVAGAETRDPRGTGAHLAETSCRFASHNNVAAVLPVSVAGWPGHAVTYVLQAMLACATTAFLIVCMRRPAERLGLIDLPGGRKRHEQATPLTGGLAIAASLFGALSFSLSAMGQYQVLLVAIALLAAVGVLDDRGRLGSQPKLFAQIAAALLMTSWGGHFLSSLGDLFGAGPVALRNWSIPLTVFAAVAVINAINTFDGLDGLAGSLVLGMLGYFAFFAWTLGDANAMKFLVVLMGALLGFLFFNAPVPWRGPRAFMGDTGSQVLGIVVVWFSIDFAQPRVGAPPPATMLWVVGVVLLDFFTITVRRLVRRRNPAAADRAHLHHLLMRQGLSPARVVLVLVGVNLLFGAVGISAWRLGVPERTTFAAFLVVGITYVAVFLWPVHFIRLARLARGRGRTLFIPPVAGRPRVTAPPKTVSLLAHPAASGDRTARPDWRSTARPAARHRRASGGAHAPPS